MKINAGVFRSILPYLILGLFLRLILIPTTIHPDLRGFNLAAVFIAQKGEVFTFYDQLRLLPPENRLVEIYIHDGQGLFIYPPLAYLTQAAFDYFLYPLYPHQTLYKMFNYWDQFLLDPNRIQLLYLLKLPYLIPDLICLLVIRRLLPDKLRFSGSLMWIFNPISIYSAYMIGQFDIFIAMFILIAVYFSQKKPWLGAVTLALAAGYKPFPLLLLPLLPGNLFRKIINTLIGLATFFLIILPYLPSQSFRTDALLAGQSDKLIFAKVMVSGAQYLSWFFVALFIIYWINLLKPEIFSTGAWLTAALLPFYAFTDFHPQWFTWFAPLLTLAAVGYKKSFLPALVLVGSYIVIVLSFESSLNFGLFGIQFSFFNWINHYFPGDEFVSIIRSMLAASAFILLIHIRESEKLAKNV